MANKTLKVGETMKLSKFHWVERLSEKRFVYTVVILVGGTVSYGVKTLKLAIEEANKLNDELTARGRVI